MPNFIPKIYKKEAITIRVSCEKLEQINKLADDYRISRNELINQCIDYALNGITGADKTIE